MAVVILFETLSWQIGLRVVALHEFLSIRPPPPAATNSSQKISISRRQFLIRDRLDEFLGRARRAAVELAELSGSAACRAERLALRHHLADQSGLLSFCGIEAAAGEQKSRTTALPRSRFRRGIPPNPGIKPKRNSGKQKRAILSAMIRSQTRANSSPPPKVTPLTAAMVVSGEASIAFMTLWMRSRNSRTPRAADGLSIPCAP